MQVITSKTQHQDYCQSCFRIIFKYKGMKFGSIEGFFRELNSWIKKQTIYFQGKPIKRGSEEYASLVEEIYISALQNPFF